jgi:hypothetical protein
LCVWRTWMVRILHLSLCQFKNTKLLVIIHSFEEQKPLWEIAIEFASRIILLWYSRLSVMEWNQSTSVD